MPAGDAYWKRVDSVWDSIPLYDGPKPFLHKLFAAPPVERTLFAAHWCQSEVCNGGFDQFFNNSAGVLAPEAVEAFRSLGMPRTAEAIDEAVAMLGSEYPRDRAVRQAILAARSGDELAEFNRLERDFYQRVDTERGGFVSAADAYANLLAG